MIATGHRAIGDAVAAADVAIAAQLACLLEASAPKPGNVSPRRHFGDVGYEEFLASAAAIGAPMADAGSRPLGETIHRAIDATSRWTRSNTNLGMVLLLAPIARAAIMSGVGSEHGVGSGFSRALRGAVRRVLDESTVDDAREVYAAIRRAAPGGLGKVDQQDVAHEPTQTLIEVMRLGAPRDGVAREYATGFELTFLTGAPALERARRDRLSWSDATIETFLMLLAASPDTHIARRGGVALAAGVSRQAAAALDAGGVRSAAGRAAIDAMDRSLRGERPIANPGTTADLTAAAIFVVLLGGGWRAGAPADGGRDAASR
jgi:triphosphoribosyl-dephospho-CoA synthase